MPTKPEPCLTCDDFDQIRKIGFDDFRSQCGKLDLAEKLLQYTAILRIIIDTGMRISEVAALGPCSIHRCGSVGLVYVPEGKTHQARRVVYVCSPSKICSYAWNYKPTLASEATVEGYTRALNRAITGAVGKAVTVHDLRRWVIIRHIRAALGTGNMIDELLRTVYCAGHFSPSTTMARYMGGALSIFAHPPGPMSSKTAIPRIVGGDFASIKPNG